MSDAKRAMVLKRTDVPESMPSSLMPALGLLGLPGPAAGPLMALLVMVPLAPLSSRMPESAVAWFQLRNANVTELSSTVSLVADPSSRMPLLR